MLDLKDQLERKVAHPESGCLSIFAKSLGEGDFREAVEDHILARLRKDARDPLLDYIKNPARANKRISTLFQKYGIAELLGRNNINEHLYSCQVMSANREKEQEQVKRCQELEVLVKDQRDRLLVLGYEVSVTPTFNIEQLHRIAPGGRDETKRDNDRCDSLFRLRFGGLVNMIESSSVLAEDDQRLVDLHAVLKECLDIEITKSDIITYEGPQSDSEEEAR
jgi:hypothetical protein